MVSWVEQVKILTSVKTHDYGLASLLLVEKIRKSGTLLSIQIGEWLIEEK